MDFCTLYHEPYSQELQNMAKSCLEVAIYEDFIASSTSTSERLKYKLKHRRSKWHAENQISRFFYACLKYGFIPYTCQRMNELFLESDDKKARMSFYLAAADRFIAEKFVISPTNLETLYQDSLH